VEFPRGGSDVNGRDMTSEKSMTSEGSKTSEEGV